MNAFNLADARNDARHAQGYSFPSTQILDGQAEAAQRCPEHLLKALDRITELEAKLRHVEGQAKHHIDLAHRVAKERESAFSLLNAESSDVPIMRFRALQKRVRNQRHANAELEQHCQHLRRCEVELRQETAAANERLRDAGAVARSAERAVEHLTNLFASVRAWANDQAETYDGFDHEEEAWTPELDGVERLESILTEAGV